MRPIAPQTLPFEHLLVTDRADPSFEGTTLIEPRSHLPGVVAAKLPKFRPDLYTDSDIVVWLDANIEVVGPEFLEHLCNNRSGPVSCYPHPVRDDVLHEAHACAAIGLGVQGEMLAQVEHYRGLGLPDPSGLWCCGVMVRERGSTSERLGELWLGEVLRWSARDQLSFPFVTWSLGIEVGALPPDDPDDDELAFPFCATYRHGPTQLDTGSE